jgi:hypothetical protein
MKKMIALTAVIMVFVAFNLKAQSCPPGMTFGGSVVVAIDDCFITADYCLSDGVTISGSCDIHFSNVVIHRDEFDVCELPVDENGNHHIPWSDLIGEVVDQPENFECFDDILPCDSSQALQAKVTTGGCYEKYVPQPGVIAYIPCDTSRQEYCRQYYTICLEPNGGGGWKVKTLQGPPAPAFNCIDPDCDPLCGD